MNFVILFVLAEVMSFTYSKATTIENCFYVDGEISSIEISCKDTQPTPEEGCYDKLYSRHENVRIAFRQEIISLKLLSDCSEGLTGINEIVFSTFINLKVFDLSNLPIENLYPIKQNLDKLLIGHNKLTKITSAMLAYMLNVTELNFGFNRISTLERNSFWGLNKLKILDLSNNLIKQIDNDVFRNNRQLEVLRLGNNPIKQLDCFEPLVMLKHLDLRITQISSLNFHQILKLDLLHLEGTPLQRISCSNFVLLINSTETHISLQNVTELDTSCVNGLLQIEMTNASIIFRSNQSHSQLIYPIEYVQHLKFLNLSSNHLNNTQQLIQHLGSSVETLDLSSNFVGSLNSNTFRKLINLRYLYLSNTNLSNFGLRSFMMMKKLNTLDLSGNNLNKVDFSLLLRNFKELNALNLEGNNLTEVNTITSGNFPKLISLGLSKNNFSCEYLAKFLQQWTHLQLLNNPSDDTHIDGVDCHHEDEDDQNYIVAPIIIGSTEAIQPTELNLIEATQQTEFPTEFIDENYSNSTDVYVDQYKIDIETTILPEAINELDSVYNQTTHSTAVASSLNSILESRIIERLMLVLCMVCCCYLMMKTLLAQRMMNKVRSTYCNWRQNNGREYVVNDNDSFSLYDVSNHIVR